MTDDMLRALAKNGGVVGVNFGGAFLNVDDAEELKKAIASSTAEVNLTGAALDAYAAKEQISGPESQIKVGHATVDDAAACIDHIIKVAGIDHVGIGSDFDGIGRVPKGLEGCLQDAERHRRPVETLATSEVDIQKIMGGNFLPVIREVVGQ